MTHINLSVSKKFVMNVHSYYDCMMVFIYLYDRQHLNSNFKFSGCFALHDYICQVACVIVCPLVFKIQTIYMLVLIGLYSYFCMFV
jgi:hypothetical protein